MTELEHLTTGGDADVIASLAIRAATPHVLNPHLPNFIVVPEGHETHVPNLEQFLDAPSRKRGIAKPATLDAFTAYVTRHQQPGTTIWVHPTDGKVVAILDDHLEAVTGTASSDDDSVDSGIPGHGDHRALLQLLHTPEWLFWIGKDSSPFDQEGFTEHIEDGVKEIVTPPAADMLEIARTFHAKGDVTFSKVTNLHTGESQLTYNEGVEATAGDIKIPREIDLAIAPFVGGPKYAVKARFRYKASGGRLTLTYRLDRPHDVVNHALSVVADELHAEFPNVYIGEPR